LQEAKLNSYCKFKKNNDVESVNKSDSVLIANNCVMQGIGNSGSLKHLSVEYSIIGDELVDSKYKLFYSCTSILTETENIFIFFLNLLVYA